ncbi:MAG: YcxB family protein [Deltaproteobacteria bacterium]|nr:YcxB family protein [Deltaproteobacteria bacterium]
MFFGLLLALWFLVPGSPGRPYPAQGTLGPEAGEVPFVVAAMPFVLLPGVVAVWVFGIIPFLARRRYRSFKAIQEATSVTVQQDGLFFERDSGRALMKWTEVHHWRANKQMILVYPGIGIAYPLPRRFFSAPESFEDFKALVEARCGKQR